MNYDDEERKFQNFKNFISWAGIDPLSTRFGQIERGAVDRKFLNSDQRHKEKKEEPNSLFRLRGR